MHSTDPVAPEGGSAPLVDPPQGPDAVPEAGRARRPIFSFILGAVSALAAIAFIILYFALPAGSSVGEIRTTNFCLGMALFLGLFTLGVAIVHHAKVSMSGADAVEERHPIGASDDKLHEAAEEATQGVAAMGMERRPFLKGALVVAAGLLPVAGAVPLVSGLSSTWDVSALKHTIWGKGVRLVTDPGGVPIRAADVTIGSAFHVIPENLADSSHPMEDKAKAVVLLLRLDPRTYSDPPGREGWSYEGILAYSKICTHVGCPVALAERQTHHLLCPCHQSTFDIANGAKVIFGPAKRPLPQLPITVDAGGYLIAQSDFHEPVGPSFWERER